MRQYGVDGFKEAHVEHLVGFVEHHGVYLVELHHSAVDKVNQSAGCGDYNLHTAFAQGAYLALDARAAVDRQHFHRRHVFGKVGKVAAYLQA